MVKNFREGIRLVPVSSDPLGAVEGQLQYSDGTARDEGVYVFINGSWEPIGGSGLPEPKEIVTANPKLETDTTNWVFTLGADFGSSPTGSMTRNTTNPLAGDGDLSLQMSSGESGSRKEFYSTVSYDFTLNNRVEKEGGQIEICFDMLLDTITQPGVDPVDKGLNQQIGFQLVDVDQSTTIDTLDLNGASIPETVVGPNTFIDIDDLITYDYEEGDMVEVKLNFNVIDITSINYRLIIYYKDEN